MDKRLGSAWASVRTHGGRSALVLVLATLILSVGFGASAEAYNTFNNHRLKFGVVGQKYWDSPSAHPYHLRIRNSWIRWNSTNTPISVHRTTVKANSHVDFYKRNKI